MSYRPDSIGIVYEPMSRRLVISFAVIGVVLFIGGLIARPANITVAVWFFLAAVAILGLAGYGVLDRAIGGRKRSRSGN